MADSNVDEGQPSFEAALAELQQIVGDLEDGKLGLEPSLARFEQGIGLLRNCHRILEQAEQKIEMLVRLEPDGAEVSAPFDASATFASEAPQKKTGRRKTSKPAPGNSEQAAPGASVSEDPLADPEEKSGPSLF